MKCEKCEKELNEHEWYTVKDLNVCRECYEKSKQDFYKITAKDLLDTNKRIMRKDIN